jgi:hypothetical protein
VADVAQLVESQIVILVVAGSSPVVRPIEYLKAPIAEPFSIVAVLALLCLKFTLNSQLPLIVWTHEHTSIV